MKSTFAFYECDCSRMFSIEEREGDVVEEPCCPECGSSNAGFIACIEVEVPDVFS